MTVRLCVDLSNDDAARIALQAKDMGITTQEFAVLSLTLFKTVAEAYQYGRNISYTDKHWNSYSINTRKWKKDMESWQRGNASRSKRDEP